MSKAKLRYKISIVLLAICIAVSLFLYLSVKGYEEQEREASKQQTNDCILEQIAWALVNHYETRGSYPNTVGLEDLVYEAGYPKEMGCGPTSIRVGNVIVDTNGNQLMYEYTSVDSVRVYFESVDVVSQVGYELNGNQISQF